MSNSSNTAKTVGLWGLTSIVISSMIGSGVYALPQNMAAAADAGAVIIAWLITGLGIFCLVKTFHILSLLKPNLTSGIYSYAQDGFGKRTGFLIVWGYWLCNIFANTSYAVILMQCLDFFFPSYFTGGNNINSFLLSSAVIWGIFVMTARGGIRKAALVNLIGTVAKLIPLAIFILAAVFAFKADIISNAVFNAKIFKNFNFGDLLSQVRNTMIITLWSFIGIETALAISDKAENSKDIAKSIFLSFFFCLAVYFLVSFLPFGILARETIASFQNPSAAGVLKAIMGNGGAVIIMAGMTISVSFCWLSWTIVAAEITYGAAKAGACLPKQFCRENKDGTPAFSLLITTITTQMALFLAFCAEDAWNAMINITAVMLLPAYIVSALYLLKITAKKRFDKSAPAKASRVTARIVAFFALIYSVWLLYAANIKYFFLSAILFAIGIPVFLFAKRQLLKNKFLEETTNDRKNKNLQSS
jgi:arginine:ornithine antiporter/lysine permease